MAPCKLYTSCPKFFIFLDVSVVVSTIYKWQMMPGVQVWHGCIRRQTSSSQEFPD